MVYLLLATAAIYSPHPQSIKASIALSLSSLYLPLYLLASLMAYFISSFSSGVAIEPIRLY